MRGVVGSERRKANGKPKKECTNHCTGKRGRTGVD